MIASRHTMEHPASAGGNDCKKPSRFPKPRRFETKKLKL